MASIVVAIDLGTSRSACAYSVRGKAEEAIIFHTPDGSGKFGGANQSKTETAIRLKAVSGDFVSFGLEATRGFIDEAEDNQLDDENNSENPADGCATPTDTLLFRFFKVELCQSRGYRSMHDPVAKAYGGEERPLVRVMTAALRHIKDDMVKHLRSKSAMPMRLEDIQWVVTVPAIYDDFAKNFMRHAACEAGITEKPSSSRLILCLEPEAACLAVTAEQVDDLRKTGNKVMILDCGGGTVDITTHEILSVSPLALKEILAPTGGYWGSVCVDNSFKSWLKSLLGQERYELIEHKAAFYRMLTDRWEDTKTMFIGNPQVDGGRINFIEIMDILGVSAADWQLLISAYNDRSPEEFRVRANKGKYIVKLPCALVASFFVPTIEKITKRLRELKQDPALSDLNYIFLVGGFSWSPLLQSAVRDEFKDTGCTVVLDLRPDLAVIRGAVMFAQNTGVIRSRKARCTYGIRCLKVFDSTDPEHLNHRATLSTVGDDKVERISVFSRHICAGDDIPVEGKCPILRYFPVFETQVIIVVEVLASHLTHVEFPDKGSCYTLASLIIPIDRSMKFEDRGIEVQFAFGGTELSVTCVRGKDKKIIEQTMLNIAQDVQQSQ